MRKLSILFVQFLLVTILDNLIFVAIVILSIIAANTPFGEHYLVQLIVTMIGLGLYNFLQSRIVTAIAAKLVGTEAPTS